MPQSGFIGSWRAVTAVLLVAFFVLPARAQANFWPRSSGGADNTPQFSAPATPVSATLADGTRKRLGDGSGDAPKAATLSPKRSDAGLAATRIVSAATENDAPRDPRSDNLPIRAPPGRA